MRRSRKMVRGAQVVGLLAVMTTVAACGSSGSSKPSQGSAKSTVKGAKFTVAVVPKSVGLFYWGTVHAGAEAAAQKYHVNIVWKGTETETDVSGQVNILQDFITKHISGIAYAATDAHGLVQTAQSAKKAGIPVVNIDSGITPQTPPLVATNNITA
ncbi:MAG: substrate-binding domain-containing protein, partial [Solirubrobacteraceae bacterium]